MYSSIIRVGCHQSCWAWQFENNNPYPCHRERTSLDGNFRDCPAIVIFAANVGTVFPRQQRRVKKTDPGHKNPSKIRQRTPQSTPYPLTHSIYKNILNPAASSLAITWLSPIFSCLVNCTTIWLKWLMNKKPSTITCSDGTGIYKICLKLRHSWNLRIGC